MASVDSDLVNQLARQLLRSQRLEGRVVLWAFQNPEEIVRLPEERDE